MFSKLILNLQKSDKNSISKLIFIAVIFMNISIELNLTGITAVVKSFYSLYDLQRKALIPVWIYRTSVRSWCLLCLIFKPISHLVASKTRVNWETIQFSAFMIEPVPYLPGLDKIGLFLLQFLIKNHFSRESRLCPTRSLRLLSDSVKLRVWLKLRAVGNWFLEGHALCTR